METPKEDDLLQDVENLAVLRSLVAGGKATALPRECSRLRAV